MGIRCEYPVTWRLWRKQAFLEQLRGRALSINIYLIVLILFLVFVLRGGTYWIFISLLIAGCLYLLLVNWLIRAKRSYDRMALLCGGEAWTRTVLFRQSSLSVTDGRAVTEHGYRHVVDIREKNGTVTLRLDRDNLLLFPTDTFTEGSWEDARARVEVQMNNHYYKK